jgi:hypothetical protein
VACVGTKGSLLERGESVTCGQKRFDDYFDAVAQLRDKVEGIDSDMFPVRQPLTEQLESGVDTSMAELLAKLRDRVEKLRGFGMTMALTLSPEPRVVVQKGKLEADLKDERLALAVEDSAKRALTTFKELGQLLAKASELELARAELAERINKLDPKEPNRDLIEDEVVGAGRVLDKAQQKLLGDSRTLALYLISLSLAADTGATAPDVQCAEPSGKGAKKPPKTGPGPKGPPPPPRPPTGGEDFEM